MTTFNFTLPIYQFDDWSSAANTNDTVYYNGTPTFSLDSNASLIILSVSDDDRDQFGGTNTLDDGYVDTPGSGASPSTGNNDQVLTSPVTVNGTTYQVGDQVELEFAFQTTTGEEFWIIRIDGQNVGISGSTLPTPGTTYTVAPQPTNEEDHDGQQAPIESVPCFTAWSRLLTPQGWRPISELAVGDMVQTVDNGWQEIRWLGSRAISKSEMTANLQPIVIPANSFREGVPARDLVV